ncbi:MAG TPA: sigma-70 family RNA polymerase sigma factor [Bacillales bacterium]|nr:sigma-70 family RNA polymerase sigma factor [Bacillales bacterium]
MGQMTDAELYSKVQSGDQNALELLYDKYEKLLYSFSYRMTKQQQSAEEVVQEVFIKVWKGQGDYDPEKGKFSSWLLTIARNASIDLMRKQKVQTFELEERDSLVSEDPSTEDLVEWKETGSKLRKAVLKLGEEQRMIIESFYFKGNTQRFIAEQFDLPLGTVKGRIRLALKHLRETLNEWERGDEGNGKSSV